MEKTFSVGAYASLYAAGSFAFPISRNAKDSTVIESVSGHSCRETFIYNFLTRGTTAYSSTEHDKFIYYHQDGKRIPIINFIKEVEERLKLEPKTEFYPCQDNECLTMCEPNPWWFENIMRLSLLTILLRCAVNYEGDFEKALYSINYAANTKDAIENFFKGFTKWAGTESATSSSEHLPNQATWKWGWAKFFEGGRNLNLMIK